MDTVASVIVDIDESHSPHEDDSSAPTLTLHGNALSAPPTPNYHLESTYERPSRSIFPRTDETTLLSLYPPHLKLHFVQLIHRHGHRTPLVYRLPSLISYPWRRCYLADHITQQIASPGMPQNSAAEENNHRQHPQDHAESIIDRYYIDSKGSSHHHAPTGDNASKAQRFQMLHDNPLVPAHLIEQSPELALPKYRPGECYYGQLTDTGREHMSQLGKYWRDIYVHWLGFLPFNLTNVNVRDTIYLRSTNYPRTIESLQSVLCGLYTPNPQKQGHVSPLYEIHVRQEENESMYPWLKCIKYRELQSQFKRASHSVLSRETENVKYKLKHLFSISDTFGSYPSYHGLFDNLYCLQNHGIDINDNGPLGLGVSKKDMQSLELISVKEWFSGYEQSDQVVRLGIGRFLSELVRSLEGKAKAILGDTASSSPLSSKDLKMELYSGHDTTIAPLLCAFKVFDESWPSFGSNITFELLEDTLISKKLEADRSPSLLFPSSNEDTRHIPATLPLHMPSSALFVRMKSNDQVFQLPACIHHTHPDDPSLCQYEQFLSIAKTYFPTNLTKECDILNE